MKIDPAQAMLAFAQAAMTTTTGVKAVLDGEGHKLADGIARLIMDLPGALDKHLPKIAPASSFPRVAEA